MRVNCRSARTPQPRFRIRRRLTFTDIVRRGHFGAENGHGRGGKKRGKEQKKKSEMKESDLCTRTEIIQSGVERRRDSGRTSPSIRAPSIGIKMTGGVVCVGWPGGRGRGQIAADRDSRLIDRADVVPWCVGQTVGRALNSGAGR